MDARNSNENITELNGPKQQQEYKQQQGRQPPQGRSMSRDASNKGATAVNWAIAVTQSSNKHQQDWKHAATGAQAQ